MFILSSTSPFFHPSLSLFKCDNLFRFLYTSKKKTVITTIIILFSYSIHHSFHSNHPHTHILHVSESSILRFYSYTAADISNSLLTKNRYGGIISVQTAAIIIIIINNIITHLYYNNQIVLYFNICLSTSPQQHLILEKKKK